MFVTFGKMYLRLLNIVFFVLLSGGSFASCGDSVYVMINGEKVYKRVQFKPEYPGGTDSLLSYIDSHLNLSGNKTGGSITVSFIISSTGKLHTVNILNDIPGHPEYASEARRVLLSMPLWKPAMRLGKPVSCIYTMPISFVVKTSE